MAVDLTVKSDGIKIALEGYGQGAVYSERVTIRAGAANTGTTYALATTLNKVSHASVHVNGTSNTPVLNEFSNTDGNGNINAGGTSVSWIWTGANANPKNTDYFFQLYGT